MIKFGSCIAKGSDLVAIATFDDPSEGGMVSAEAERLRRPNKIPPGARVIVGCTHHQPRARQYERMVTFVGGRSTAVA